ncbi:hypothetical protein PGQ11_014017 [Apiospora arundinis]|uniref:C2H2-type domain-containing protein n=1 Tax=Apiospora arundinis TaxID=335852 RepID=A0ABR2HR41_9PEZI
MPSKSHKNNGPKRKRLQGSVGHPSPSPGPSSPPPPPSSPSENTRKVIELFRQVLSDHVMGRDSGNLACPFLKHDPGRYASVINSCTITGFKDVGSLRDHIKRVHSRKFGCTECFNHRFNCAKGKLKAAKIKHQALEECKESKTKREKSTEADVDTAEWMSEEQERDYEILDLRKARQNNLKESFREIYTHLWPESKEIPDYSYGSGFIISMPVIEQVLEKMTLGPTGILSSTGFLNQHSSSYEQGTMAEPEPEEDPTPQEQQEELSGMPRDDDSFYASFMVGPSTAVATGIVNRNYQDISPYCNNSNNPERTYPPSGSFSLHLASSLNNSNNDQSTMNASFTTHAPMADPRVQPFSFNMPASTGQSNTDSGYGTVRSTGNDNGCKPPAQIHQQRAHHDFPPLENNWVALRHTGGPPGPEDPPEGEDIQLDEEELSYDFNNLPNAGDQLEWALDTSSLYG